MKSFKTIECQEQQQPVAGNIANNQQKQHNDGPQPSPAQSQCCGKFFFFSAGHMNYWVVALLVRFAVRETEFVNEKQMFFVIGDQKYCLSSCG